MYFDDVEQLGVGQVYNYLGVSNEIGLKVSGPCIFYFSRLLRFDVVVDVLSQFTLRHGEPSW